MDTASRDENHVTTLLGVSSVDGKTPVNVFADPNTHRLLVNSADGGVVGPGSSNDMAVARWNGTAGDELEDSVVTVSDTGDVFTNGIKIIEGGGNLLYANGIDELTSGDSLNIHALLFDGATSSGNDGDVLTSTGSGTLWVSPPTLPTPVADGTYTVGLGTPVTGQDGLITIVSGVITAIQEAM